MSINHIPLRLRDSQSGMTSLTFVFFFIPWLFALLNIFILKGKGVCLSKYSMNSIPSCWMKESYKWIPTTDVVSCFGFWHQRLELNFSLRSPQINGWWGGHVSNYLSWISLSSALFLDTWSIFFFFLPQYNINRLTDFSGYFQAQSCPRSLKMTRLKRPSLIR